MPRPGRKQRRRSLKAVKVPAEESAMSLAGAVYWLPKKEETGDLGLQDGCYDHPVLILSRKGDQNGHVSALQMTSFGGRDLLKKFPRSSEGARRYYLPIKPAKPHPDSGEVLTLAEEWQKLEKNSYVYTKHPLDLLLKVLRPYREWHHYTLSADSYKLVVEKCGFVDASIPAPSPQPQGFGLIFSPEDHTPKDTAGHESSVVLQSSRTNIHTTQHQGTHHQQTHHQEYLHQERPLLLPSLSLPPLPPLPQQQQRLQAPSEEAMRRERREGLIAQAHIYVPERWQGYSSPARTPTVLPSYRTHTGYGSSYGTVAASRDYSHASSNPRPSGGPSGTNHGRGFAETILYLAAGIAFLGCSVYLLRRYH